MQSPNLDSPATSFEQPPDTTPSTPAGAGRYRQCRPNTWRRHRQCVPRNAWSSSNRLPIRHGFFLPRELSVRFRDRLCKAIVPSKEFGMLCLHFFQRFLVRDAVNLRHVLRQPVNLNSRVLLYRVHVFLPPSFLNADIMTSTQAHIVNRNLRLSQVRGRRPPAILARARVLLLLLGEALVHFGLLFFAFPFLIASFLFDAHKLR